MNQSSHHTIRRKPVAAPSAIPKLRQPYIKVQQQDDGDALSRSPSSVVPLATGWNPFWSNRVVLIAFMICFASMIVALEFLDLYSIKQDGIASINMDLYYLWTYGPTAILTTFLAFWNRVDYRVRHMAPWTALSSPTPATASKTIFLDYISPTRPEILWHALTNRDWAVLISSIIGVLQTVLIILSTGLLSGSPVSVTFQNMPYRTATRFVNDGDLVTSLLDAKTLVNVYDAIQNLNLSYPYGTTDHFCYQEFAPTDTSVSAQSVQQAIIDVLAVDLDCEPAELQVIQWMYSWALEPCWSSISADALHDPGQNSSIFLVSSTCNISMGIDWDYGKDGEIGNFVYGTWDLCNKEWDYFNNSNNRMAVTIGQAQQIGDAGPHPAADGCDNSAPVVEINLVTSKSWICTPRIEVTKATVTFNSSTIKLGASPSIQIMPNAQPSPLTNISFWDFDAEIVGLVVDDNFLSNSGLPIDIKGLKYGLNIGTKALERSPNATVEKLMTTDLYLDLFKGLFRELGVQSLHSTVTVPDDGTVVGSLTRIEDRLIVRSNIAHGMQSLFGILLVLVGGMVLILPRGSVVPYETATLGGLLSILTTNPEFRSMFQGQGSAGVSHLHQKYSQSFFHTRTGRVSPSVTTGFVIEEVTEHTRPGFEVRNQDSDEYTIIWWTPLTNTKWVKTLMFSLTIATAVLLQVLLAISKRNSGLADVSIENEEHLAWSYIPAAVMVGVAIYFKALHSTYRMFAPYCRLRTRAGSKASDSLNSNYMSATEIEVLGKSVAHNQYGIFFITLSAVIAAFLTIVVSGVFSAAQPIVSQTTLVSRKSWFNSSGSSDNGTIGNSALIAGLVLESNLSYPAWTHADLALASLQYQDITSDDQADTNQDVYTLRVTSPAIRSSLNCTMYGQKDFEDLLYSPGVGSSHSSHGIFSKIPGPPECAGDEPIQTSATSPAGGAIPFNWSGFVYTNTTGCPTLNYFWGYQESMPPTGQYNTTVTYAKALTCFEVVEQVDVTTVFSMPSFVINDPPLVEPKSSKIFSSENIAIPYNNMPSLSNDSSAPSFFGALTYTDGITEDDLGNPNQATSIASAIQRIHGIIRAQQYNAVLRSDGLAGDNITYTADVERAGRYRLIQNEISTHVLTVLLLAMLLCVLFASLLISTKQVLPKNPSSIAAMASFLADSNILRDRHDDVSGARFENLTQSGAMYPSDAVFRMGWFENSRDGSNVFTINRIDGDDKQGRASVVSSEPTEAGQEMQSLDSLHTIRTERRTVKKPRGTFEWTHRVAWMPLASLKMLSKADYPPNSMLDTQMHHCRTPANPDGPTARACWGSVSTNGLCTTHQLPEMQKASFRNHWSPDVAGDALSDLRWGGGSFKYSFWPEYIVNRNMMSAIKALRYVTQSSIGFQIASSRLQCRLTTVMFPGTISIENDCNCQGVCRAEWHTGTVRAIDAAIKMSDEVAVEKEPIRVQAIQDERRSSTSPTRVTIGNLHGSAGMSKGARENFRKAPSPPEGKISRSRERYSWVRTGS